MFSIVRGCSLLVLLGLLHLHPMLVNGSLPLGDLLDTANDLVDSALEDLLPRSLTPDSDDPDIKRTTKEIIDSRGFIGENHDVVTKDGYIITIQHIVNPLVEASYRPKMKPVIMQHGLMSSSADFVINSVHVRPEPYPKKRVSTNENKDEIDEKWESERRNDIETVKNIPTRTMSNSFDSIKSNLNLTKITTGDDDDDLARLTNDSQERPNSIGFYLANRGYDVWLANSRGNFYAQRHVNLSSWNPKFWDFTFDEQIQYDLPAIFEYIQGYTNKTKLGYIGHSQGTVMMFGLLSDKPEYADIIEPFVAFAPVTYCNNAKSPAKYLAVYTPIWSHVNVWCCTSSWAIRYLAPLVCSPKVIRKEICANLLFLGVGFDEEEFDQSRITAILNHTPSGTSVKNIAHYGQEILSGRFAHFDHGVLGNMYKYGSFKAPDYDLTKIRSKSIALFTAENDWLGDPKDLKRLLADLRVPVYYHFNATTVKPKWNHIDFVYGKDAGTIINPRVEKVMDAFRDDNEHQ